MFAKYFTPKEANALLPSIKPIVTEILVKGRGLRGRIEEDPAFAESEEAKQIQENIVGLMAALEKKGCLFKDWNFEIGLVDFPVVIDGEDALLCWRSDEAEVLWFHGLQDGYPGRRPIPEYWLLEGLWGPPADSAPKDP